MYFLISWRSRNNLIIITVSCQYIVLIEDLLRWTFSFRDQLNSQNPLKFVIIRRILMKPQYMSFEYVLYIYIYMCYLFCCRRVWWLLHHQQFVTAVVVCSLTCEVSKRDQTRNGSQTGGHAQRRRSSPKNSTTCHSRSCQTCRSSASHSELVSKYPPYHSLRNGRIQK